MCGLCTAVSMRTIRDGVVKVHKNETTEMTERVYGNLISSTSRRVSLSALRPLQHSFCLVFLFSSLIAPVTLHFLFLCSSTSSSFLSLFLILPFLPRAHFLISFFVIVDCIASISATRYRSTRSTILQLCKKALNIFLKLYESFVACRLKANQASASAIWKKSAHFDCNSSIQLRWSRRIREKHEKKLWTKTATATMTTMNSDTKCK